MTQKIQKFHSSIPYIISFLLIAFFCVFTISASHYTGKLSVPAYYDDVSYFVGAMGRVLIGYREGLWALILDFANTGFHSYHSELVSMLGFMLFGLHNYAPSIVLSLFLFLVLILLIRSTANEQVSYSYPFLVLLFLSLPASSNILLEITAYNVAYFFTAIGLYLYNKGHRGYLPGVLIAYSCIAKMTVAPVILTLAGLAFVVRMIRQDGALNLWRNFLTTFNASALSIYALLLLLTPFYLLNLDHYNEYVYRAIFGEDKDVWQTQLGTYENFRYHLTGGAATFSLGQAYWLIYICLFVQLIYLALKDTGKLKEASGYVFLTVAAYSIVTIANIKNRLVGAVVPVMIIVLFFDAMGYWLQKARNKTVVIVILSGFIVAFVANKQPRGFLQYSEAEISAIEAVTEELAIISNGKVSPISLYVPFTGQINKSTIQFSAQVNALLENEIPFTVRGSVVPNNIDDYLQELNKYEYILYPNDVYLAGLDETYGRYPGLRSEITNTMIATLGNTSEFKLVTVYDLNSEQELYLYKNLGISTPDKILPVRPLTDKDYSIIVSDLNALKNALDDYHKKFNAYPKSSGYDGLYTNYGTASENWIAGLAPDFIEVLPRDPRMSNDGTSQYLYLSNGTDYKLIAHRARPRKHTADSLIDPIRRDRAIGYWTPEAADW